MPVRALVLLVVLAVSIVPALGEEYGYFADDDFIDTEYDTDEYGTGAYVDNPYDRYDTEVDPQYDRDTHRVDDYVHVKHVASGRSRPARVAHDTPSGLTAPSELTMPGELAEPIDPEYEELPLESYEDFGSSCDNCVGDDLCNDCQADCDSCAYGCGGLSAGAEMTILNFHPDEDADEGLFGLDDDFNYEVAPRVWIGYEGSNDWGIRGRYWQYDAELNNSLYVETGETFVLANICQELDVYTVDIEITRRFCLGRTAMRSSIGARNGAIRRGSSYGLGIIDDDGADEDATSLIADLIRVFDGTGLTFAFEANRPLLGTRLEAVVNARGSALWGDNEYTAIAQGAEAVPDGAGNLDVELMTQDFGGEEHDTMWIGELQAGLQWTQPYQCFGGGVLFVRSVFEAQWWAQPNIDIEDLGTRPSERLAFYGMSVSAGFSH
jgi:hypothetical protein